MGLLIIFISLALVVSFLCSVFEAVLLSVTTPHIALLEKQGKKSGILLRKHKNNINMPLAAILSLNTIAHTIGAAGAGAQATKVFGDAFLGAFSAILTFLILVFSEIIPKTIGANYWERLSGVTAYCLRWMIIGLYPFIVMSDLITRMLGKGSEKQGLSRSEFAVMAEVSEQEGHLGEQESRILQNLLNFKDTKVKEVMTPRIVVFSADQALSVKEFLDDYDKKQFSRIPIYQDDKEHITGFVLRTDLLLALSEGEGDKQLAEFKRDIQAAIETSTLFQAFDICIKSRSHIMLIVDEYGQTEGILTQEDLVETLLGLEIMDESDKSADLQVVAKRLWKRRSKRLGFDTDTDAGQEDEQPNLNRSDKD